MKTDDISTELARCLGCRAKPCEKACPLGVSPHDFIAAARNGNWQTAAAQIAMRNPLPQTCGLVCPDRFCQSACIRARIDKAVEIPCLQAKIMAKGGLPPLPLPASALPRRAAIVGGGPAGLGCLYEFLLNGWLVDLYEKSDKLGGAARLIPEYRLPKAILDAEIARLVENNRVTLHLNTNINDINALVSGYDAVVLAIGEPTQRTLGIKGEEFCLSYKDFLGAFSEYPPQAFSWDAHTPPAIAGAAGKSAKPLQTRECAAISGITADVPPHGKCLSQSAAKTRLAENFETENLDSVTAVAGGKFCEITADVLPPCNKRTLPAENFASEPREPSEGGECTKEVHDPTDVRLPHASSITKFSPARAAVVGGGEVALDCSLTLRRLGCPEVEMFVRRRKEDMRIMARDYDELAREGVMVQELRSLTEVSRAGQTYSLKTVANRINGEGRAEAVAGTEETLSGYDIVIMALGSYCSKEGLPENIITAGDMTGGCGTIVQALASGRDAARRAIAAINEKEKKEAK